jgi:peptidoglycan/xylan/chitin deacetylase (PgdA/CDA1 family)
VLAGKAKHYDRRIVSLLRQTDTPATIFMTGLFARTYPGASRSMARDPLFELANHSYSHLAFRTPCYGLPGAGTKAERTRQIVRARKAIKAATGVTTRWFRFPGGCHSQADVRLVYERDHVPVQWDVISGDAYQPDSSVIVRRVLDRVRPGSIVVMHLSGAPAAPATYAALKRIIPALRARGYRFVTLSQLLDRALTACKVRNKTRAGSSRSLAKSVGAAKPKDRLTVQGTCKGHTTVGKDLSIRGVRTRTSGPPTLRGDQQGPVLLIRGGASVSVRGLTIRGRSDREIDYTGGGIRNVRSSVMLWGVTVRDFRTSRSGGGIHNLEGTLRLRGDSRVKGNRADRGGGIMNRRGTLVLAGDSSVSHNRADDQGGGLHNDLGQLTMLWHSSVADNDARSGGGLYDVGGALAGVVCAPSEGANIRDNTPDDCAP